MVSNGRVVEYDKLRFQSEIICNAVCEEFLQECICFYPRFSVMLSNDISVSVKCSDRKNLEFYMQDFRKQLLIYLHESCLNHGGHFIFQKKNSTTSQEIFKEFTPKFKAHSRPTIM